MAAEFDATELDQVQQQAQADIAAALEFAEQSPLPEPEQAYTDLYRTPIAVNAGELSNG